MEAKYTKGPWGVRKGFFPRTYEVYPKRPGEKVSFPGAKWGEIATLESASKGESVKANANLIAAAPELLETLEDLLEMPSACVSDTDVMENNRRRASARAAIAKALGGAK